MSHFKARRSFYAGGRRFQRGSAVDLDTSYLARLEQRGLVFVEPAAPAPSETKVIAPAETKTIEAAATEPAEPVELDAPAEAADSPQDTPDDLERLDYKELKKLAKAAGIKGYNSMKKDDMIKKLRESE